jgi:glycosyltransferase involved in cell wall biosynthesis
MPAQILLNGSHQMASRNYYSGESAGRGSPGLSVIVPFHRNREYLTRCVRAARAALDASDPNGELIVVADAAPDPCADVVAACGGVLLPIGGPSGPAVARNRGAVLARGSILLFVDSDVIVEPDAFRHIQHAFANDPGLGAIFGAYDEDPYHSGLVSQARNLAHSFVHQRANSDASTFWAGLGAVRRTTFFAVGGFDERFTRPSVEDIELGYRLRGAGGRIVLDHRIRGKHLKRWTAWGGVKSDLFDRGIPWTQLLHRYRAMRNDLNVSRAYRACVVVAYLALLFSIAAVVWSPLFLVAALACLLGLVALDLPYYAFFVARRGWLFTARWFPLHVLHHLCNGVSFAVGSALFVAASLGLQLPGTLPVGVWRGRAVGAGRLASSN